MFASEFHFRTAATVARDALVSQCGADLVTRGYHWLETGLDHAAEELGFAPSFQGSEFTREHGANASLRSRDDAGNVCPVSWRCKERDSSRVADLVLPTEAADRRLILLIVPEVPRVDFLFPDSLSLLLIRLVELSGIEPLASSLRTRRSPN